MSFQAMTWALSKELDSAGEKLVLLMLANYCNAHTGQCNPSHRRLAKECCMGESTLKRHIQSLEKRRLLKVINIKKEGVNLPNQYELKLDGVGPIRADGGSNLDLGVGPIRATNLEVEPVNKPKDIAQPQADCFLDGTGLQTIEPKKSASKKITFKTWMEEIKQTGQKAVSDYKPVWQYAESVKLPQFFVEIAWLEFKDKFLNNEASKKKLYVDWRATFKDYVSKNYLRLWYYDEKSREFKLTTAGKQLEMQIEAQQ